MNMGDLRADFRRVVDDKAEPYLYSNADFARLLNEAHDEACVRTQALRVTADITMVIGTSLYDMPAGWFVVDRATHSRRRDPIEITSGNELDARLHDWELEQGPDVEAIVCDWSAGKLRVFPIPSVASTTIRIHGARIPVDTERFGDSDTSKSPVTAIASNRHMALLQHVYWNAYQTRDADAKDLQRSAIHGAAFTDAFGPQVNLDQLRIRAQKRRQSVRAHWM